MRTRHRLVGLLSVALLTACGGIDMPESPRPARGKADDKTGPACELVVADRCAGPDTLVTVVAESAVLTSRNRCDDSGWGWGPDPYVRSILDQRLMCETTADNSSLEPQWHAEMITVRASELLAGRLVLWIVDDQFGASDKPTIGFCTVKPSPEELAVGKQLMDRCLSRNHRTNRDCAPAQTNIEQMTLLFGHAENKTEPGCPD